MKMFGLSRNEAAVILRALYANRDDEKDVDCLKNLAVRIYQSFFKLGE